MTDRLVAIAINSTTDFGVTTIGTTISGTFNKFRASNVSDSVNRGAVIEENLDVLAPGEIDGGDYSPSGSIDGTLRLDPGCLNMLKCFMGVQATTTPSTTLYMTQTPYSTATLLVYDEQARNNQGAGVYYTGLGITSMEISLKVKDYAKIKFSWIARRGVTVHDALTTAIPTEPTDWSVYPMSVFYNAVLTFGGTLKTKGMTLKAERKYDQDYKFLGSQFLQGLYLNGMSNLGGTLDLGAGEYDQISKIINGNTTAGALDNTNVEFAGSLANPMSSGVLSLALYRPGGSSATSGLMFTITVSKCYLTDFNRSVQNRNMWEKTINWQGSLPASTDFSIVVSGANF